MNFLAHAVLSFGVDELLAGNILSDFIKGKKKDDFPLGIRAGIELHRAIDSFTDDHPINKEAKRIFMPTYRLYASSVLDIVYDYFVATDDAEWEEKTLENFSLGVYASLGKFSNYFPPAFSNLFPYMKSENWLLNYREDMGILKSLGGLKRRALYITEVETAFRIFLDEKEFLRNQYNRFFPELKAFALNKANQWIFHE